MILAIPAKFFDSQCKDPQEKRIARLITDFFSIEKRIDKEVNIATERLRLFSVLRNIQEGIFGLGYFRLEDRLLESIPELHPLEEFVGQKYFSRETFMKAISTKVEDSTIKQYAVPLLASCYNNAPIKHFDDESNKYPWLETSDFPYIMLDSDYVNVLHKMEKSECSLENNNSIISPNRLEAYINNRVITISHKVNRNSADEYKDKFFQQVVKNQWGIIELQVPYLNMKSANQYEVSNDIDNNKRLIDENSPTELEEAAFKQRGSLECTVYQTAIAALNNGNTFSLSNHKDSVISEVLHRLVFTEKHIKQRDLPMTFVDGSSADSIPTYALKSVNKAMPSDMSYHVSMMSMRHLTLDETIDFCWYRNFDVSRTNSMSEIEKYCYQSSLAQFKGLEQVNDGVYTIYFYQTGFSPALIGFYRALVQCLLEGGRMQVIPKYFTPKFQLHKYSNGSTWMNSDKGKSNG